MTSPAAALPTIRLLVRGIVQGVGFRPYIYREAAIRHLTGWVRNTPQGAEIQARGNPAALAEFEVAIRLAPPPARVDAIEHLDASDDLVPPGTFVIRDSATTGDRSATLLPDLATCPDCLREINDPANRRHRYPFTNCTACGPRYSIIANLPYDRERTTMRAFTLCPACRAEFHDPADRRFHAQPNACPACGPHLELWNGEGHTLATHDDALRAAARHLREGRILAIKGLGGFHLFADAANATTLRELRHRKHRAEKPFAVMVPDLDTARTLVHLSPIEQAWLTAPAAPIVLLRKRPDATPALPETIAPGNPCLGLFLPYTPLHHLLLQELRIPVVATSANLSDEPLCTDEHEALEKLHGIADYFLIHNRPIAHPVDDSVLRIVLDRPLILRAARGLAPVTLAAPLIDTPILGTGAHMKVTAALRYRDRIVVSPHIGDLETLAAESAYDRTIDVLTQLHEIQPARIACDLHPGFYTTRYATQRHAAPHAVQHHHAHILAVIAEHQLTGPVLGIAWDGTGLGPDGTIWGGEVLRVDEQGYRRIAHLRPFPLPGGDAAAREPRRSALGLLHALYDGAPPPEALRHLAFTPSETTTLLQAIRRNINTITTTSAGRLFDAASALLGLCQISTYEGHAAMLLQAAAENQDSEDSGSDAKKLKLAPAAQGQTLKSQNSPASFNFLASDPECVTLDWSPHIRTLLRDHAAGHPVPVIAARFHHAMVQLILAAADLAPDLPVVLAGGCFQNAWLLEHTVLAFQTRGRPVHWPHRLPPNDGAIAAGQLSTCP